MGHSTSPPCRKRRARPGNACGRRPVPRARALKPTPERPGHVVAPPLSGLAELSECCSTRKTTLREHSESPTALSHGPRELSECTFDPQPTLRERSECPAAPLARPSRAFGMVFDPQTTLREHSECPARPRAPSPQLFGMAFNVAQGARATFGVSRRCDGPWQRLVRRARWGAVSSRRAAVAGSLPGRRRSARRAGA